MKAPAFLAADWPAAAHVVAGTTLRFGGSSAPPFDEFNLGAHVGDEASAVTANRERLGALCGLPAEPLWLRQVHGTRVVSAPTKEPEPEADASVTTRANTVCAVLTADCLPVLLASADGGAVGAAHAGWRGLCAGVLEATVESLGRDPGQLMAWLGPAISQAAFEVGGEVREQFLEHDAGAESCFEPNEAGRWQADLYGLARLRLRQCGVTAVYGGGRCTFSEQDAFFSYRRDGRCGRMASLIFRR